jgi:hypothetical protein
MKITSTSKDIKQGKLKEVVKTENGKIKEYAYNITKNANVVKKGGFKV